MLRKNLDCEALEGISGGWTSDQLTPEERAKINRLHRAIGGAQTEEEELARMAEFQEYNLYLSEKSTTKCQKGSRPF